MEFLINILLAFQLTSFAMDYQASNLQKTATCSEFNAAANCVHNRKYKERPTW